MENDETIKAAIKHVRELFYSQTINPKWDTRENLSAALESEIVKEDTINECLANYKLHTDIEVKIF